MVAKLTFTLMLLTLMKLMKVTLMGAMLPGPKGGLGGGVRRRARASHGGITPASHYLAGGRSRWQ